jgi:hypothetical protein
MWSKLFVTAALFVAAALLSSSGCSVINSIGPNCDRSPASNEPVAYTEGQTTDGVYKSSPWGGELLWFPGGMRYDLVLQGWTQVPDFVDLWLSFAQCGTKNGTVARAAGNQAEVRAIRHEVVDGEDRAIIEVVNGSCSDYWLLVVAGSGSNGLPGPTMAPTESDGVCETDGGTDGGG